MSSDTAFPAFPQDPGTYALVLELKQSRTIQVGRLGELDFSVGYYIYLGSAFGPGGLYARLLHHLRISRRPHWHIDYLRRVSEIIAIWYCTDPCKRESDWVDAVSRLEQHVSPIIGFGASDSNRVSHLYYFLNLPSLHNFRQNLQSQVEDHAPVCDWMNPSL